jgi:nitroreductase
LTDALALLSRRRSVGPAFLTGPAPSAQELETLLTLASRVPDHGKLAPWRFIVFQGEGARKAGEIALELRLADNPALDEAARAAELTRFSRSPLVIAVVSRAAPHVKIPEWEQVLSAGASAMALEVAASALGLNSIWLTEWCAYDARFCQRIGLAAHERVAAFVHVGRAKSPPEDRPRPALADIVTYF